MTSRTASLVALFGGLLLSTTPQPLRSQEEPRQEPRVQRPQPARVETRTVVVSGDGRVLEMSRHGVEGAAGEGDGVHYVVLDRLGLGRGYLGVQLVGLTDQLRERFGVPAAEGALVSEVVPGGPADRAGVRAGDVITAVATSIGSEPVRRTGDVGRLVADREGEAVDLELYRGGRPTRLTVDIAERQRPLLKVARDGDQVVLEWIGGASLDALDAKGGRFLDDALEGLGIYFESDEWRERALGGASRDEEALDPVTIELRIEALKKRMSELRRQLEGLEREPGS